MSGSSEKRLRDAVEELLALDILPTYIAEGLAEALAGDETDIERLRGWLLEHRLSGELDDAAQGQQAFIEYQLDYTADHFGGEKGE